ncbi:hypothetical protein HBI56_167020 [Parastagonospora nodorum]|uniref:Uncharacterized protein n=1 Tax=Phaeosphaeria nodorum (strain SN15 / ATCC MYA-4574 / FGSC 10173) TaxID=321614 RepID=A0A7U2IBI9_PHANO|nr:hypothetical protein HBH56_074770 [Parastagonospora nodorum]QRD06791.1 hypothetical protein JI435_423710 [Parastagonospora nodorum SN15]KAH3927441.1 hypothetical protein HBH54_155010 [Parastagonospora nodorum]KAH3952193.1 hypothetical protein HBH53_053340 [Parastagonospora nodorum]KAH3981895.1 hypothetical protein HBH51_041760 [Parastagonospora nodorum]
MSQYVSDSEQNVIGRITRLRVSLSCNGQGGNHQRCLDVVVMSWSGFGMAWSMEAKR